MNKKIPNNDKSVADDLFSSLLDDVNGISDENGIPEDTIYDEESLETVDSEVLFPKFKDETEVNPLSLAAEPVGKTDIPDYWDSVEKLSEQQAPISLSDIPADVGSPIVEKYEGPSADDNFLDQIKFNLSPEHVGGVVKVSTNTANEVFPSKVESNPDYDLKEIYDPTQELKAFDATKPVKPDMTEVVSPETINVNQQPPSEIKSTQADIDKTIAVTGFAQRQKHHLKSQSPIGEGTGTGVEDKIFMTSKTYKSNTSQVSIDASLAQAENLRIAQNRILDLEKEIERLRQENDEILTATEIIRNKSEEFTLRVSELEKENQELKTEFKNENSILKGSLVFKESENAKLQEKIEELELRIKNDFKKIRIRERELENRLELLKAEKQAVVKSKDDLLLELQRKNDISKSELETYRNKVQELNKTIESYQNQIKITVRTLRLALSHVEDKGENQPIQYKKAT